MKKSVEQVKQEIKSITVAPAYAVVPLEDALVLVERINALEIEVKRLSLQAA